MPHAIKGLCMCPCSFVSRVLKNFTSMMEEMTKIALAVGPFLPGSYPQFMVGKIPRGPSELNTEFRCVIGTWFGLAYHRNDPGRD